MWQIFGLLVYSYTIKYEISESVKYERYLRVTYGWYVACNCMPHWIQEFLFQSAFPDSWSINHNILSGNSISLLLTSLTFSLLLYSITPTPKFNNIVTGHFKAHRDRLVTVLSQGDFTCINKVNKVLPIPWKWVLAYRVM